MENRLKIVILENISLFSSGIKAFLEKENFLVVGEASEWDGLFKILQNNTPDVLLLDLLHYPDAGIKSLEKLRKEFSEIPVLVITNETYSDYFRDYLMIGVYGLIYSNATRSEMIIALNKVAQQQEYFPEGILHVLRESLQTDPANPQILHQLRKLTSRENSVLKLFCNGLSYKEIGKILGISTRTVETHKKNILAKLKLKSTVEMVKYAMVHHLI
jgi:RNA polymerase sigma factor (sigma-70 family)